KSRPRCLDLAFPSDPFLTEDKTVHGERGSAAREHHRAMHRAPNSALFRWGPFDIDDFQPRLERGAGAVEQVTSSSAAKRLDISVYGIAERTAGHGPREVIGASGAHVGVAGKGKARHIEAIAPLELHFLEKLRCVEINLRATKQHRRPVGALRSADRPRVTARRDRNSERH